MAYCLTLKLERKENEVWFDEINPGFNTQYYFCKEAYLLDRVLSRIKSITVLQYPRMVSELTFKRLKSFKTEADSSSEEGDASDMQIDITGKRISEHTNSTAHMQLNTSDICRFMTLVINLYKKGFLTEKLSKLLLDLCHCVYKIDSVEFREKVDVPIHIAKTLSEFIQFVEAVHRSLS
jgi:hypothetical protein